ncbi:hypothetical protein FAZ79_00435 [Guyparkeria sp. SB14A]|uniref:hypothetical protein n=1 Tax=Guyparkeria sp. SB14A TaxID=2571147 RepID=UPI0010AC026F|nr:hypothetical protein [Guyparkeria sp. SB14A]TKA91806.1 hypothetical protein FAZ79_00435 [Guyparkeria sp. SB14A]
MQAIKPKTFEFEGCKVRVLTAPDGKPWFFIQDVARALQFSADVFFATHPPLWARCRSYDGQMMDESTVSSFVHWPKTPRSYRFMVWLNSMVLPEMNKEVPIKGIGRIPYKSWAQRLQKALDNRAQRKTMVRLR